MYVVVVIVNFRSAKLTIEAVRSALVDVLKIPGAQIVIVDNDSPDDSCAYITEAIAELLITAS